MTNKLEQLKKKMEEAQIAHNAAFEAALAAADAACSAAAYAAIIARDANAAAYAANGAALTYKTTKEAYNNELNKNNDKN